MRARTGLRSRLVSAGLFALATAALVGAIGVAPARAETTWNFHVYPDSPWKDNVQNTIARAPAGSRILLHNGVYSTFWLQNLNKSGIVVRGESKAGVVVKAIYASNTSGMDFGNLTVSNPANYTDSTVMVKGNSYNLRFANLKLWPKAHSAMVLAEQAHNIEVSDNVFDGAGVTNAPLDSWGIYISSPGSDTTKWVHDVNIFRNEIRNFQVDGIFVTGGRQVTINKNLIHDLQRNDQHNDGVQLSASVGVRITANRFYSPGDPGPDQGIMIGRGGVDNPPPLIDTYIANNVISNWRGTGIIVAGAANTRIVNNSIAHNGTDAQRASSIAIHQPKSLNSSPLAIMNNVLDRLYLWSSGTTEDYNCVRGGNRGTHDVTSDPKIDDFATLRLQTTSPCIGTGIVLPMNPTADFSGQTRSSTSVNMGAYA